MNAFVAGATGPIGTHFVPMTEIRGTSNAKARSVLGWQPPWPTWRAGFAKGPGR